jgi:hypothetical protein
MTIPHGPLNICKSNKQVRYYKNDRDKKKIKLKTEKKKKKKQVPQTAGALPSSVIVWFFH